MKRRLLHLLPVLALGVLLSSSILSFVAPARAYAAIDTGQINPNFKDQIISPKLVCSEGDSISESILHWMICPIADGLSTAVVNLDNIIDSQMTVGSSGTGTNPNQIFCDSKSPVFEKHKSCEAYHNAWKSTRDIALGLMVVVGIIILISQAVGLEILDAYTIRKVMPRLVIAALAITLSWQLMQFFVELTNSLGYGIRAIIYAPFASYNNPILAGGGQSATILLSLGALTAFGFIGLLTFFITAGLAVIVGFIVLVLRQLLIIMLIIFAPLAIVAYILPNTQKYYKMWWESFSKALLMFAMISAMIAIGRVFAVVCGVNQNNEELPFISQLVGFIAYFIPYLLIPLTFKYSGAAMSAIGGAVQRGTQPAFAGLKGYRGNTAKKNWQALKDGNRLGGTGYGGVVGGSYSAFARQFNRATEGTANFKNAGFNPRRFRSRMSAAKSNHIINEAKEAMEKNHAVAALVSDDDLVDASNRATIAKHNGDRRGFEAIVREDLENHGYHNVDQGVGLIHQARSSVNDHVYDTAMGIAQFGTSSGLTPTFGVDPATGQQTMHGGAAEGRRVINEIAGNDRQRAIQMLGAGRQLAESKGRYDLSGGSFTQDAEILDDMHRGHITETNANQLLLRGALDGNGRGRIFSGHRRNIDAMAPQVRQLLDESFGIGPRQGNVPGIQVAPGNPQEALQQLALAANTLDAAAGNSAESARVVNDQVLSQQINVAHLSNEMQDLIGKYLPPQERPETVIRRGATLPNGQPGPPIQARDALGRPAIDNLGRPVYETEQINSATRTVISYGELMEAMRSHPEFGRYRREWGSGQREQAAQAGQQQPPQQSDIRLKRNIQYLETSAGNINIYRFQYIWSDQIYVGVMAQELLRTHPHAVITGEDGFYRVNYSVLGLEMLTLEEYLATPSRV